MNLELKNTMGVNCLVKHIQKTYCGSKHIQSPSFIRGFFLSEGPKCKRKCYTFEVVRS